MPPLGPPPECTFDFVAQNTREGRVLRKLLDRLAEIRADLGSDQVFDVVGEVFPANQLERMLRDLFAASVKDGRGRTLHRRLFAVETSLSGEMRLSTTARIFPLN